MCIRDRSNECQYQCGDEIDVWRSPEAKDLVGWRGPARITNLLDWKENKCHVEWQGQMVSVPLDQIRPHILFLVLYGQGKVSNMWTLLKILESDSAFYGHSTVFSMDGKNRGAERHSEVFRLIGRVVEEIGIPVDTAAVGLGVKSLPPLTPMERLSLIHI